MYTLFIEMHRTAGLIYLDTAAAIEVLVIDALANLEPATMEVPAEFGRFQACTRQSAITVAAEVVP